MDSLVGPFTPLTLRCPCYARLLRCGPASAVSLRSPCFVRGPADMSLYRRSPQCCSPVNWRSQACCSPMCSADAGEADSPDSRRRRDSNSPSGLWGAPSLRCDILSQTSARFTSNPDSFPGDLLILVRQHRAGPRRPSLALPVLIALALTPYI